MIETEEVDYLWGIALGKKAGWQYSDFPVVKDKLPKFAEAWKKSKKKTQYKTGKPISVEMVEQYWIAEARQRRMDREKKIKVSQPVGATVWLNDERWNNGVEAERTETKTDKRKCKCGMETHGPKYDECDDCMGKENGKLKGWGAEMMRDNYVGQDINYSHLNRIHKPGNFSTVLKLIHLWNRTAHNAHVKTYNSNRYRKN